MRSWALISDGLGGSAFSEGTSEGVGFLMGRFPGAIMLGTGRDRDMTESVASLGWDVVSMILAGGLGVMLFRVLGVGLPASVGL